MKIIQHQCTGCNSQEVYSDGLKTYKSDTEVLICIKCGKQMERKVDEKDLINT